MIKIFLVEDEILIRNAIKSSIDWDKEGYKFVGEASDGELAYPLIMKTQPDILITDIKMPFMDGLELSEMVKKEIPDIKIVILSGYNDFDYAKRAISIGITEYILKPVSAEKLLEVIGGVAEVIKKEKSDRELLRKYVEDMQENVEQEKNRLFNQILAESLSVTETLEIGRGLGMNLAAECYNILLFKLMDGETSMDKELKEKAWTDIDNYFHSLDKFYCFRRGIDGFALLCMGDGEEDVERQIETLRERIHDKMLKYPQMEYFGGIGKPVSRIRNIRDSFHEAERAFAGRFVTSERRIVYYEELNSININADEPDVEGAGSIEKLRKRVSRFLRNGTVEEIPEFMKTCFEEMPDRNLRSMMMRQYIMMDIYLQIITFGDELELTQEEVQQECGEMKSMADYLSSEEKTREYAEQMVRKMIELRERTADRRYSDIIQQAQSYILKNYMTEEISLNAVSASVNMSPSYFSSIFGQEVGKTFVEYLTEIRMDKAKELLMCSSKKTSEIGYEVGYKDSHYFSYIFKKTQGCSPKDYRSRGKD